MRAHLSIAVFVLLFISVLALGHYHLWRRLIADPDPSPRARRGLTAVLLALVGSMILTMILMRDAPRPIVLPLAYVAFVWMGLASTYLTLTAVSDLGLGLRRLLRRLSSAPDAAVENPARRRMLGRIVASSVAFGGTTLGAVAVAKARGFRVARVDITLDKLPPAFDGTTIVQLSDVHVGPTIGRGFVESIVRVANAEQPDLVAITGDLVDGSVENLGRHTSPLSGLRSRYGTFFVTGNHEYYSGADEWVAEVERLGMTVLRNGAARLERNGQTLLIAGVTDFRAGRYGDPPDLKHALRTRRPDEEVVLLAHQPRALDEAARHDIGLQLSGHTHGGQFWPWNWVIHLIEPVVSGWAKKDRTQIYVSSGTGYWGPPMRLGTEAEITVVKLRAARRDE